MTTRLRRSLWALALAFLALETLVVVVLVGAPAGGQRGQLHAFAPLIAATFTGTGLFAWARRPETRIGPLMVAVGFAWLVATLVVAGNSWLYITGWVGFLLPYAVLLHLLVVFPSGRTGTRLERAFLVFGYGLCTAFQFVIVVFFAPAAQCGCEPAGRHNPLMLWRNDSLYHVLTGAQSVLAIGALGLLAYLLAGRWRRAGTAQRHVLAPVYAAAAVIVVTLTLTLLADLFDAGNDAEAVVDIVARVAMACVPFAFLAGLVRARLSRATAVGALVERLGATPERRHSLRDALADALGDPTLSLAFRVGDGYVDAAGHPVTPTGDDGWTTVERDGRPVGAIVHDPALAVDDPAALRTVAGAAALALENERLDAELRAHIEELRESRARIVHAGDAERRRLERDLHDGAQQRLMALALTLRLARARAGDGELGELLAEAAAELSAATAELRELARGIHPAVLADRGLAPAIDTLAGRSAVPVEVGAMPEERLPAPIEAAAYFLVAEALTNVARYAGATHAAVSVTRVNGSVTVEVSDDGVGGADPGGGSGLRGLADRVAALDGRFELSSAPGAGTTVRAVLPCAS